PFGLGCFRLLHRSRPMIASRLAEPGLLRNALEHVLDNHDAAQAELASVSPSPFDPMRWCVDLAGSIAGGRFDPGSYDAIDLPKPHGGTRRVEQPGLAALVVATHVQRLLEAPLDRQFEPQSYGFRKGRSREDAAGAIDAALADGYRWLIETDIADFFGTIDRTVLERRLRDALVRADAAAVDLAMLLVAAPFRVDGALHARQHGIPQGLPLSPLLANLYLDPLDEWLAARDVRVVRYADDLVVLCRTEEQASALLAALAGEVAGLHLSLAPDKTRVARAAEGFEFLGFRFPRVDGEAQWRVPLRRALHVVEPYCSLGVRGDAVEIRQSGRLRDLVPLRRLDRILLHAPAVLSTALIRRASSQREPVAIAASSARDGEAMLLTPVAAEDFDIAHRQAVRYDAMSEAARDAIAREWVAAKIENCAAFLGTRYRSGLNERLRQLRALAESVHAAATIDTVRGVEGAAARIVFAEINAQIGVPEFRFRRRERSEPDRMNPLFNFGYYLLFQYIQLELRGLGLNPYLGFLHRATTGKRYESLVCDVQEPFRCHVDRLLLRLVNLKVVRPEHVDITATPPHIDRAALRAIVEHFERELGARPARVGLSLGDAITAQCMNLRDFLCDGRSFYAYRWPKKTP
ncbi:MAG TPA: CRISPR-associated endonuclease Cas1, partial [Tahibacter sp.]|nr:CRISPR-associated endonuclease Cas1 [Tahibacter sp.]